MSSAYLLRLELPDTPGSLGAVATALGAAGADIAAVSVVEKTPTAAIDDFVVDVADENLDAVRAVTASLHGVRVEVFRPIASTDVLPHEIDLLDRLVDSGTEALSVVTHFAAQLFQASWALVLVNSGGAVVTRNATPGSPVMLWASLPWFPLEYATSFEPDADWIPDKWQAGATYLAAAPVGDANTALLVGRRGGPRFRGSEIERLGHLAHATGTVGRRSQV